MNNNNLARLLGPIMMYIPCLAQIEAQITIIGVNNSHNSNRCYYYKENASSK